MKETYQQALLDLLQSGMEMEQVLAGFRATLKARGHERLYVPVLRGVASVLTAGRPSTIVTVAREADSTAYANEIATTLQELGASASSEAHIDETLVGGYVVEHDHARVDNSYKTKLIRLYRSLTA